MGFHRILCPVDFSDTSAEAARYAASLAGRHSAELTLLHVAPPIGLDYALIEPTQNRLREIASHRNQIAWQAFESFPTEPALAVPAKRELVEGEAPEGCPRRAPGRTRPDRNVDPRFGRHPALAAGGLGYYKGAALLRVRRVGRH